MKYLVATDGSAVSDRAIEHAAIESTAWDAPLEIVHVLTPEPKLVDGSLVIPGSETAVDHGVAPTFVILNDTSLGMVRQMDDSIPGVEFHDTDFVQVAEALGGEGHRITDPDDLEPTLEAAKANDVPTVLDVRIDREPDMAETLQSSFYAEVGGLHE